MSFCTYRVGQKLHIFNTSYLCVRPFKVELRVIFAVKPDPVSGLQVVEGSVAVNSATVTWKSPNGDYAMLFRVSLKSLADNSVRVSSTALLRVFFMTDLNL